MFLNVVSDFCEFLSVKTHSLNEILAHITLRVFSALDTSTAFICQLNENNLIESLGVYGIGKGLEDKYPNLYSFNEHLPVPVAMRNRKIVWINDLPEWPDEYPGLKGKPAVNGSKTFICFPIEKSGTPVAAIGIFCSTDIRPSSEIETFLKTIGHVLSLHLYKDSNLSEKQIAKGLKSNFTNSNPGSPDADLSERQQLILKMISEGRTNSTIGDLLGYSESTVRQETIKIFAKLGCNGREEASKIYREKQAQTLKN
jgi:hypothetical protein